MRAVCTQIIGVDALITREVRNTHKLLYQHINTVRSIPMLENAMCVLNFESNLAFESQQCVPAVQIERGARARWHVNSVSRWLTFRVSDAQSSPLFARTFGEELGFTGRRCPQRAWMAVSRRVSQTRLRVLERISQTDHTVPFSRSQNDARTKGGDGIASQGGAARRKAELS